MSSTEPNRIFLCHASEDKKQVIEVYDKLKALGFNPWLDKRDLLPGQQWGKEIPQVLKKSRFIIIFFSRFSVSKRGYVQREFKMALDTLEEIPEDRIFIIPVRLNDCHIPEAFRHIHYVDLFDPHGLDLVVKVIIAELGDQVFNDQYSESQSDIIKEKVELFKNRLNEEIPLNDNQTAIVQQKLDELIAKIDQNNKFDFRTFFFGVLTNIASSIIYDSGSNFWGIVNGTFGKSSKDEKGEDDIDPLI